MRFLMATIALAALGCGSPAATAAPANETALTVAWQDYVPGAKASLDRLAQARDCASLQTEFEIAIANGPSTLARAGHDNSKIMAYIDAAMRGAGCY